MNRLLAASPVWVQVVIGFAAVGAGAALTLKPFTSLEVLTIFIGISLILAGIGESLNDEEGDEGRYTRLSGALLIVVGLAALFLRDQTIRFVAIAIGIGLIISGVARFGAVLRRRTDQRYAELVGGLASIVIGVLALSWPDVTILVVALLVGPLAVILGIKQLFHALLRLRGEEPESAPARSTSHRWRGAVMATASLVIAGLLVVVSAYLNDDPAEISAFYDAPANLPGAPGQLLRSEEFDRALPENSRAVRMLYTTTAFDGSIAVASGIVIVPAAESTEPLPVILWNHGTTGIARNCAPSLLDDPLGSGAMPARQAVIDNGWAIVVPDYFGLGTEGPHPYMIGPPTAHSSLDAVRAARQIDSLNLSDQTVAWGHSQGGGAALWVGIESLTYAPDVPLLGVAAMAPASDLSNLAVSLQADLAGRLFAAFILDAYSDYYSDVEWDDYLRPAAREIFEIAVGRCLGDPATLISIAAVLSGESPFSRDFDTDPIAARLAENVPGVPTGIPTFLGQGLSDPLILPDVQEAFVQTLCDAGQVIELHAYAGRDHIGVVADDSPMIPDLIAWTAARFAGEPAAVSCTVTQR